MGSTSTLRMPLIHRYHDSFRLWDFEAIMTAMTINMADGEARSCDLVGHLGSDTAIVRLKDREGAPLYSFLAVRPKPDIWREWRPWEENLLSYIRSGRPVSTSG